MSKDDQKQRETGFKVTDRRMFTADGEPISAPREEGPAPKTVQSERPGGRSEAPREAAESPRQPGSRPAMDFSTFIISLATSAMAYLGEVPDPTTGKSMQSLEGAQQMIEILSLLQEKTRGNLDPEEAQLLEEILYELRMKFLAKAKVISL